MNLQYINMNDERQGLPSCSELARVAGCPGMLNRRRALGPLPERDSEDAASGTRCHSAYAGDTTVELSDDELSIVARATRITTELVDQLGFTGVEPIVERRFFCGTAFTGKPDRVYIKGVRAFIPDLKAGRIEVEAAESNKQLRGYVVLMSLAYPELEEIYTAPIQPHVTSQPVPALYGKAEIAQAFQETMETLEKATDPAAPLVPGPWCKYCKVREAGACSAIEADTQTQIVAAPKLTVATPTQIGRFLDWLADNGAEATIKAYKEEAKRLLESGAEIPGWTLKPNAPLRPINDPDRVWTRAEKLGVTYEQFKGCVEIGKGALEKAVKAATGQKGKALEATMADLTDGCLGEKPKAASLQRSKE